MSRPLKSSTDCTATATPSALTVKALAGGSLPGRDVEVLVEGEVSLSPDALTTALAGTGGVVLATVELLVTGKSSKPTASLPAVSAITVPVVGTA